MNPPWLIRVSTRPERGAGHAARMRALGDALERAGSGPVRYVTDPGPVPAPLAGRDQMAEAAAEALDLLAGQAARGIILDSYDLPADAAARLGANGPVLEVVDSPKASAADLVLAHGLYDGDGVKTAGTILAGPHYALLPPALASAHDIATERMMAPLARKVVVCFGARDGVNASTLAVRALAGLKQIEVRVLLPSTAPHKEAVAGALRDLPQGRLVLDEAPLPHLLWADLAIGAGGVSLLERLCCGLPGILLTLAENQRANAEAAAAHGVVLHLGDAAGLVPERLTDAVASLAKDKARRKAMRDAGLALVDGRGADRVAAALGETVAGGR